MQRQLLRVLGCRLEQASFFAGHLTTPEGESVYVAARRAASLVSLEAARRLVAISPHLRDIERQRGRDRVALPLARRWNPAVEHTVMKAFIARALADDAPAELLIARPGLDSEHQIAALVPDPSLRFYGGRLGVGARLHLAAELIREIARRRFWREPAAMASVATFADGRPGVLMLAEDDSASDPSYRRQPHWLPPGDRQAFASYISDSGPSTHRTEGTDAMVLSLRATYHLARSTARSSPRAALDRAARRCVWRAVRSPSLPSALAHAATARLLYRAEVLGGLCAALRVRSFVCGDPYRHDSDAMMLIARDQAVSTFGFQYSHLAFGNVTMATTAETMAGFSNWYAELWNLDGIRPGRFVPVGYPFDHAFAMVRERASQHRRRLTAAGARFVLAYFDENVGPPRYGFISDEELSADLELLAAQVVEDPTFGVVFKSQFLKNAPGARMAGNPTFAAALATGRMLDLFAGRHRNIVLPCEAALTADFVIGHGAGGTAVIEAALAGRRGLLVFDGRIRTKHAQVYRDLNVTCSSLGDGLEAIAAFRRGDPTFANLGSWTARLDLLDPLRDGNAAGRLLEMIRRETLLQGDKADAERRAS